MVLLEEEPSPDTRSSPPPLDRWWGLKEGCFSKHSRVEPAGAIWVLVLGDVSFLEDDLPLPGRQLSLIVTKSP